MKAYTNIEQSRKLADILPLESADMSYSFNFDSGIYEISTTSYRSWVIPKYAQPDNGFGQIIPCWSLAALLNYLREIDFFPNIEADECSVTMNINYYNEEEAKLLAPVHNIKVEEDSFIDACYELIIKLNELKIL